MPKNNQGIVSTDMRKVWERDTECYEDMRRIIIFESEFIHYCKNASAQKSEIT